MTSVTKSAYAKKHGWSPAYVTKLIAQGRVILDDNNHVLVDYLRNSAFSGGRIIQRLEG